jgi:pimeloyl-ACP methyl ester carboxylesterase
VPTLETGSATIVYETRGEGPPVLLLAPGGLRRSRIETWAEAPWNPIDALAGRHRVVAMDQRNTGTSFAPITADDGWPSYARDQLAVMDHLGIDRFAVLGMCIGGAFIMELLTEVPERITAAVALQPIGLDGNRDDFRGIFDAWRESIAADHPEATDADWEGCWTNLFGNDHLFHPKKASRQLATLAPAASLVERWKEPADQPTAKAAVDEFLAAHAR